MMRCRVETLKDGKMFRLYEYITAKLQINLDGAAQEVYDKLMSVNFQDFVPARGWPGPSKVCANQGLKESIGYLSDSRQETWEGLNYKTTTQKSFCDFNPTTNMFDNCQTQLYSSVSVRNLVSLA